MPVSSISSTSATKIAIHYLDERGPLLVLASRRWPWHPIYCWVVKHAEAMMLVDVGETTQINQPEYLPVSALAQAKWSRLIDMRSAMRRRNHSSNLAASARNNSSSKRWLQVCRLAPLPSSGGVPDLARFNQRSAFSKNSRASAKRFR